MSDRKIWLIVLAVWFLLWGAIHVSNVRFDFQWVIMGILAVVVAVLILLNR